MTVVENEIDASFFKLIHQLTGSPGRDPAEERRDQDRQSFAASQRIAPCRNGSLPAVTEFYDVPCHDLTKSGFAFLTTAKPDFDSLAVLLDVRSEPIYLLAEVEHCADVLVLPSGAVEPLRDRAEHVHYEDPSGETGKPMVMVGCRFTKRLDA